jgi:hypothetical protein
VTVLETLGKVDPGFTKWRGTLLQELIHPLMLISKVGLSLIRVSCFVLIRIRFSHTLLSDSRRITRPIGSPVKNSIVDYSFAQRNFWKLGAVLVKDLALLIRRFNLWIYNLKVDEEEAF